MVTKPKNDQLGSKRLDEPMVMRDLMEEYFLSKECEGLFKVIHPHTELCIDLKLLTLAPGRIKVGDFIGGVITRDSEDHYTFLQNASEKRKRVGSQRNPHVYVGYRINVNKKDDGTLYPTFNRPRFSENLTFKDFCRGAALELLSVADLIKEDEATV